ncbi:hypothetical protein [Chamaesiphon sp.]|uniref:hypothetical protein n=1 Tax=Chamaesiphon sp. TaxID=2814140 RepID=UPI0035935638
MNTSLKPGVRKLPSAMDWAIINAISGTGRLGDGGTGGTVNPAHLTAGALIGITNGNFTYQPVSTYVGNDSFTYLGVGSDGQISNLATVNLTVNNLAPRSIQSPFPLYFARS